VQSFGKHPGFDYQNKIPNVRTVDPNVKVAGNGIKKNY
jgi:hypothetical protein